MSQEKNGIVKHEDIDALIAQQQEQKQLAIEQMGQLARLIDQLDGGISSLIKLKNDGSNTRPHNDS